MKQHRNRKNRHIRYTYTGRAVPRRPFYPGLFRRERAGAKGFTLPRIVAQLLVVLLMLSLGLAGVVGFSAYNTYAQTAALLTPRLKALNNRSVFETSRIYDRNGKLLYEFFDQGKRTRVKLKEMSPLLIQATISIEDKTFFTNPGIDYEGILRTLYHSLVAGEETGGASTITQQVIKNIILSEEERSYENRYERKFKEIVLAQELNDQYSKEQILELYLNEVFYGNLAYGIEAASEVYFDTHASDLTLPQAALLGGLPQLPSQYDPLNYLQSDAKGEFLPGVELRDGWVDPEYELPDTISPPKWRQVAVLRQMVDEGYISEADARTAAAERLYFARQEVPLQAPHFVFYVRKLLEERYGQQLVSGGGLNIYTTLDLDLQYMVQAKAAEHIESLKERNIHNAAVVVMQPQTGQILAMVGSVDYDAVEATSSAGESGNVLDGQVNVAIRQRQPGSSLKPFTYLAAMERGMTPATVLWDVPTEFPSGASWYAPRNYNGQWNGPVRIRTALANSLNMPAVKALKFAGISYTLNLLNRVGIKTGLDRGPDYYGLSLTLGGGEVTLLELTSAYNTLASNGRYVEPNPILQITDNDERVIEAYQPGRGQQVVDPALVSILSDMMSDDKARAPIWGRNSMLNLSRPAAVKTGTSEDWRDAWTLGFTPYVTVGVWSGNNNNEPTYKVESLQGGGIIWHNVMEEIFTWIDDKPAYQQLFSDPFGGTIPETFTLPEDGSVKRVSICSLPGPFGGYNEELFTRDMLPGGSSGTPATSQTSTSRRIDGACDAYRRLRVVRVPGSSGSSSGTSPDDAADDDADQDTGASYCLPVEGESYPPNLTEEIYTWNFPDPDPGERIVYRWSGYSGNQNIVSVHALQFCTPAMFATPTPTPSPTPPVAGAVRMPDLSKMGENQARDMLARMGIQNVFVDYQTRDRIPDVFDSFAPYTVVSTVPPAGGWVYPGTSVILGIRSPDGGDGGGGRDNGDNDSGGATQPTQPAQPAQPTDAAAPVYTTTPATGSDNDPAQPQATPAPEGEPVPAPVPAGTPMGDTVPPTPVPTMPSEPLVPAGTPINPPDGSDGW